MSRNIKFTSRAFFEEKDHVDAYFVPENHGEYDKSYHNAMYCVEPEYDADGLVWRKLHPWKYVAFNSAEHYVASWANRNIIWYPEQNVMDETACITYTKHGTKLSVVYGDGTYGGYAYQKYIWWSTDCKLWHKKETNKYVGVTLPTNKGLYYFAHEEYLSSGGSVEVHYCEIDFKKEEIISDDVIYTFEKDDSFYPVEIKGPNYSEVSDEGILLRQNVPLENPYWVLLKDGTLKQLPGYNTGFETFMGAFHSDEETYVISTRATGKLSDGSLVYSYYLYSSSNMSSWRKVTLSGQPFLQNIYGSGHIVFYGAIKSASGGFKVYTQVRNDTYDFKTYIYSTSNFRSWSLAGDLSGHLDVPIFDSKNGEYVSFYFRGTEQPPYDEKRLYATYWEGQGLLNPKFENYERLPQDDCLGFNISFSGVYPAPYNIYLDNLSFNESDKNMAVRAGYRVNREDIKNYGINCFGDINEWERNHK